MHRALRLSLLALLLPATLLADARPKKQYTIEQFINTVAVGGASFSPDEKEILFSSDESGVRNVYSVAVSGGKAKALTTSTDTTSAVSYFPKDTRFLYTRDQGGNELHHLYVRQKDGSERDLTPGDKLKAAFAAWSGDKKSFFVTTNERDPKFFDLYRYDTDSYERTMIFKNETGIQVEAVSPDGNWLALSKPISTADNDLFVHSIAKNATTKISEHKGRSEFAASDFDPQSQYLLFTTNDGSEFTRLRRYDLASGKASDVEEAKWDIWGSSFSEKGRYRVTRINADAQTVVKLYDMRKGTEVKLPVIPGGNVNAIAFSPSEKLMAMYIDADRASSNLYVHDFSTNKTTQLTDTMSKDIDKNDLVDAEIARFKSFDGMLIPGVLYKPHQAKADAKAPAIVMVHGGPGGQARRGYKYPAQYLANHGFVVLDINNRGSSGYGKTFFTADDRKHGREPLWDCVEAKKYLSSLPYVDGSRVAIMGGSYGGYMVAAALAFQPDVFDVGVDIFGVTNWVRTLQNIPPWWEAGRQALYDEIGNPETELERLKETSPVFHADKIRKPLIVIQGKNDPRVIKVESDDLVEAVRKNGVPVEYVVFDDEGHGFTKKKNQITAYAAILEFLNKYMPARAAAPAAAAN
ncbi:MAG TPA: S9 family peptidase [Thermoanaerobaculia bacterium]|jgi:dipeptidyl aminopeptidase/acylaminoacyl peptidase|nr:S9 family peptidase [Thermoanaerobaculia bacterium]